MDGQSLPFPSQGGESLQKALFPQAFPFDAQPGISTRGDASSSQHLPAPLSREKLRITGELPAEPPLVEALSEPLRGLSGEAKRALPSMARLMI